MFRYMCKPWFLLALSAVLFLMSACSDFSNSHSSEKSGGEGSSYSSGSEESEKSENSKESYGDYVGYNRELYKFIGYYVNTEEWVPSVQFTEAKEGYPVAFSLSSEAFPEAQYTVLVHGEGSLYSESKDVEGQAVNRRDWLSTVTVEEGTTIYWENRVDFFPDFYGIPATGDPAYLSVITCYVTPWGSRYPMGADIIRIKADNPKEEPENRMYSAQVVDSISFLKNRDWDMEERTARDEIERKINSLPATKDKTKEPIYSPMMVETIFEYEAPEGTTKEEAARYLLIQMMESLKEEGEYRSFRVTEYKDVTVQVYEMTDIANSVENNIYSICVAEMKKNIWFVKADCRFQWEGYNMTQAPDNMTEWASLENEQGTMLYGFRLIKEGNTYTLQSRYNPDN